MARNMQRAWSAIKRLRRPFSLWPQPDIEALLRKTEIVDPPSGRYADLFFSHEGRLCDKWSHYFDIYDRTFDRFVGQPVRFLEIGVSQGGSLALWRKFLGPDAVIFGIDVDPRCVELGDDIAEVRIGSQNDPAFLASVVAEMGGVDVVLDDGSHVAAHQRTSFDTLFPLLTDGGVYMIEDVHTSYWDRWGGGYLRPGSIIQVAKGLVDGLHKWYFRGPLPRRSRMAGVRCVAFYDSIIVIEKQTPAPPQAISVGSPSFES